MPKNKKLYLDYLENLTPNTLRDLEKYVSKSVRFKDPFHDVYGISEMEKIFEKMFEKFSKVNFIIKASASNENVTLIHWNIILATNNKKVDFYGTSVITYDSVGKVSEHLDYWDAAENLYENLPIIGKLFTLFRQHFLIG